MLMNLLVESVEDGRVPEGDSVILLIDGVASGVARIIEGVEVSGEGSPL